MTEEELKELKKTYPKGWALKGEFIDEQGNKYKKGKLVSNILDTPTEAPTTAPTEQNELNENIVQPTNEMAEMRKQLSEQRLLIQSLVNNQKSQQPVFTNAVIQKEKVEFGKYNSESIPDDDYLPKKKTYIKVGKGWVLSTYYKNGKEVLAPFNMPIYFRREFDEIVGENNRVIPFSHYSTNSRKESEFIEQSPYFGVIVHTTKEEAESVDMTSVDRMENVIMNVQRMDKNSILAKAASLGLNIREDEQKLRAAITKIMISQEMSREAQLQNTRILNREVENNMFANAKDAE
jgi:hypothetical protein